MGRQLTTAPAAERQERNHEGLQHLTPTGGGQPWHEPEGAGGERGDGHGGVWVGGDQGGQGSLHHTHPHREHLVGCLNGDNGSDHSVQLRLCVCLRVCCRQVWSSKGREQRSCHPGVPHWRGGGRPRDQADQGPGHLRQDGHPHRGVQGGQLDHHHLHLHRLLHHLHLCRGDGLLYNRGLHRSTCQFERLCLNHHTRKPFNRNKESQNKHK